MPSAPPPTLLDVLAPLRELIQAERYLVAWLPAQGELQVVDVLGLDRDRVFISEALSVAMLEEVARTGISRWSDQDYQQDASLSYLLAGIKSYLCVAVKFPHQGTGLLYADDRKRMARFSYTDYTNLLNLARRLSPTAAPSPAPRRLPSAAPTARPPGEAETPVQPIRLKVSQQVGFFRSLSTFIQAGIPLLHGLHALAEQGETPALRRFCSELHKSVLRGRPLSESCRRLATLPPLASHLLYCAENSGQLPQVLATLAEYLEENAARRARVQQALVYPGLVLLACLSLALLLPTYVLRDQLQSYAQMGPLPWPTQVLVRIGDGARNPLALLLLSLLAAGGAVLWRKAWLHPRGQRLWHLFWWRNPLTARFYRARQEVALATALSLQLQAGVPLLEALRGGLKACDSPLLEAPTALVLEKVREGETLSQALAELPGLSRSFLSMLRAGEESGHVGTALEWVARTAKLDFDTSLDTVILLIEPGIMVLMGILVGFVTLASLLPTLKLMETL